MNKKKLHEIILERKIPRDMYSLDGGFPNEAYCLNKEKDQWEVYYSERGIKSQLKRYGTEEEACKALLTILIGE
ncbi:hypothetical protein [Clostridium sp. UBA7503]|uniref:hypothetical protein n=1 Tax=Clostridium sp. UBA7503 TaxID=1946377 RepID=UPI003216DB9B